jgi:hypothetical protein
MISPPVAVEPATRCRRIDDSSFQRTGVITIHPYIADPVIWGERCCVAVDWLEVQCVCREGKPDRAGVQAVAEIETHDDSVLRARCEYPRGSAEDPLSRGEIKSKFRTYAPARPAETNIEAVIPAVDRLEDFGSVKSLIDALRAAPRRGERLKVSARA